MKTLFLFLLVVFSAISGNSVSAQDVSGKYEGFAELQSLGKLPIKAEIRQREGKFSGNVETPSGNSQIIKGSLAGDLLKLTVDADGRDILLEGKFADGKFSGKVSSESFNGTFELSRVGDALTEEDLSYVLKQSEEKWREDLRFAAAELPKRHKNAFNFVSREQFEKAVAQLDKEIPALDDTKIVLGMARIFALIGDGHTALQWTWAYNPVPIRFFWFGKELRVLRSAEEYPRLVGAKLVKIGGISVEEIFRRTQPFIPQNETPQYISAANAYRISFPALLYAIGAAKSDNSAVYEFIDVNGKRFSQEFKTISPDTKINWVYPSKIPPLWLENRETPLFYRYFPEQKTVYVRFSSYPRHNEFKKFSDELFNFLDKSDVQKIAFDLRLNEGGDFTRGQEYFINPLKARPKFTEKGKLFVLAGRWTYSAGMSNTAHFRNDLGAMIVGEPTGARPNGYQEVRNFRLPNSKLEAWYSIEFYKFAETDTIGLIPDKIIEPDWSSFKNGRDPAFEWILAYPVVK